MLPVNPRSWSKAAWLLTALLCLCLVAVERQPPSTMSAAEPRLPLMASLDTLGPRFGDASQLEEPTSTLPANGPSEAPQLLAKSGLDQLQAYCNATLDDLEYRYWRLTLTPILHIYSRNDSEPCAFIKLGCRLLSDESEFLIDKEFKGRFRESVQDHALGEILSAAIIQASSYASHFTNTGRGIVIYATAVGSAQQSHNIPATCIWSDGSIRGYVMPFISQLKAVKIDRLHSLDLRPADYLRLAFMWLLDIVTLNDDRSYNVFSSATEQVMALDIGNWYLLSNRLHRSCAPESLSDFSVAMRAYLRRADLYASFPRIRRGLCLPRNAFAPLKEIVDDFCTDALCTGFPERLLNVLGNDSYFAVLDSTPPSQLAGAMCCEQIRSNTRFCTRCSASSSMSVQLSAHVDEDCMGLYGNSSVSAFLGHVVGARLAKLRAHVDIYWKTCYAKNKA